VFLKADHVPTKWKALLSWFALPYLFCTVVVPSTLLLFRRDVTLGSFLEWKAQAYVLVACLFPSCFGTIVLWKLPIPRAWLGIIAGPILSIGGIAFWVWLRVIVWGGFEANAGAAATAELLLLPSCLAGAYAGFLRYRDQNLAGSR
jgi:hypothetical protein